jgi:carboxyl-terminal processing protease
MLCRRRLTLCLTLAAACSTSPAAVDAPPREVAPLLRTEDWQEFKRILRTRTLFSGDLTELENVCLVAGTIAAKNADSPYSPEEACLNAAARTADRRADFVSRAEAERQAEAARQPFVGIGLELSRSSPTGPIRIVQPIAGSPAERFGLLPGDEIHEVEHVDITQMSLADGVRVMRGPVGATLHLRIQRGEESKKIEFSIPREQIRVVSAKAKSFLQERTLYARISQFRDDTAKQFLAALAKEIGSSPVLPRKLVLDLRGNQGGLLSAVMEVGSLMMPPGIVFSHETDRYGKSERLVPDPANLIVGVNPEVLRELRTIPITVLVNERTAAGAELIAQVLYEVRNARTVGTATYGDDHLQQWIGLPSGSKLRFTNAKLTSARDWSWNARGIRIQEVARDSRPLEYGVLSMDQMLVEELRR